MHESTWHYFSVVILCLESKWNVKIIANKFNIGKIFNYFIDLQDKSVMHPIIRRSGSMYVDWTSNQNNPAYKINHRLGEITKRKIMQKGWLNQIFNPFSAIHHEDKYIACNIPGTFPYLLKSTEIRAITILKKLLQHQLNTMKLRIMIYLKSLIVDSELWSNFDNSTLRPQKRPTLRSPWKRANKKQR